MSHMDYGRPRLALAGSLALSLALTAGLTEPARSQPAEQFYQGRSMAMIIGFDVGGGYDIYARLAARHLGAHMIGRVTVVPQNMPGAGGLSSMNHLYRSAAKDGSVLGISHSNIALGQLLDGPNIDYDARKFAWVGRMTSTIDVHYAWHGSATRNFADTKQRETFVAGTGPSSNSTILPRVLNELIGTRFRVVTGFKGTSDANLAMAKDAAFKVDADKAQMELDPMSGADLQKLIDETFAMSPPLVAQAKALYEKR